MKLVFNKRHIDHTLEIMPTRFVGFFYPIHQSPLLRGRAISLSLQFNFYTKVNPVERQLPLKRTPKPTE